VGLTPDFAVAFPVQVGLDFAPGLSECLEGSEVLDYHAAVALEGADELFAGSGVGDSLD
jgi:hypothetical protein